MGGLNRAQFEKLAQGVADGMTVKAAAIEAGYGRQSSSYYQVAKRDDCKARVAEIHEERRWGGSPDLAPVIDELARVAAKACQMTSAAALKVAKGALTEAGRLKQALANQVPGPEPLPDLTHEEWLQLFAPPKPASAAPD